MANKTDLRWDIAQLVLENDKLRSKLLNQRTELRRLNRTLRSIWDGVRFQHKVTDDMKRRAEEREKKASDERAA